MFLKHTEELASSSMLENDFFIQNENNLVYKNMYEQNLLSFSSLINYVSSVKQKIYVFIIYM